jgi:hypothetical protein
VTMLQHVRDANVRFGSKAEICAAKSHVRFAPESGHVRCTSSCLLCAKSGHVRFTCHVRRKATKRPTSVASGHRLEGLVSRGR